MRTSIGKTLVVRSADHTGWAKPKTRKRAEDELESTKRDLDEQEYVKQKA